MNTLYYGDNLDILREWVPDASVDLIYLDPPFNSNRSYNLLFKEQSGAGSAAQLAAFDDTWKWVHARPAYDALLGGEHAIAKMIEALYGLLKSSDLMAYLVMMTARLVELHRVLKPTGSLYLHCDPTASHYLKIVLDTIFGPENFRNEIIWQRTLAKALTTRQLPSNHDVILCYQQSSGATWHADTMFQAYDEANLDEKTAGKYTHHDPDGRVYRLDNLINPNPNRPNLTYEFLGVTRVWRWTRARMQAAYEAGLVVQTKLSSVPQLKRYLDEQRGRPIGDVWTDIPPLNSQAKERLGYPTQKPLALLERIIAASSNPGDVVLDPFCGCGTAVLAAERLGRRWLGIDVTYLAIGLVQQRLADSFGPNLTPYGVIGDPKDLASARALARTSEHDGRYQFQWWAVARLGAQAEGGPRGKKGADGGVDGRIRFQEGDFSWHQVIVSVKSGKLRPDDLRALGQVVEREGAAVGVLLTLEPPTAGMRQEAVDGGSYTSSYTGGQYPRLQILTVEELLAGRTVALPPTARPPGASAPRTRRADAVPQQKQFGGG